MSCSQDYVVLCVLAHLAKMQYVAHPSDGMFNGIVPSRFS